MPSTIPLFIYALTGILMGVCLLFTAKLFFPVLQEEGKTPKPHTLLVGFSLLPILLGIGCFSMAFSLFLGSYFAWF